MSFALGAAFGWRVALAAMGALGFVALGVVATQRALLVSHRAADAHLHTLKGSIALFLQAPILLCFAYFVIQTMARLGLQTFLPTALNAGLDVPLLLATSALTAYLLGRHSPASSPAASSPRADGAPRSRRRRRALLGGALLLIAVAATRPAAAADAAAVRDRSASRSARPGRRAT